MKHFLLSAFALILSISAFAQCNELFISEYIEGSNNNKALEIYNPTNAAINLGNYRVVRYSNGGTTPIFRNLAGSIKAADVYVIVLDKRVVGATGQDTIVFDALRNLADTFLCPDYNVNSMMYFNGNDAVTLEKTDGTYVDIIGKIGQDPGLCWTADTANGFTSVDPNARWWTMDKGLIRKPGISKGVTSNPPYFNPAAEWDTLNKNNFTGLGWHQCNCTPNSIAEISKTKNAFFYPNPVSGASFNVKATDVIYSVEVYNIIGQSVYTAINNEARGEMKINSSKMESGMYTIRIHFSDGTSILKKIVVR